MKMGQSKGLLSAILLALLTVAPKPVWASEDPATRELPDRITAVATLNEQINQAVEKVGNKDWPAAMKLMNGVIESAAFEVLPLDRRRALLTSASGIAYTMGDNKLAQTYAIRVCALPNPSLELWQIRVFASYNLNDWKDAALALTQTVKLSPKGLDDIKDEAILTILRETRKLPDSEASFDAMAALYTANWKLEGSYEPSSIWRDYAVALVERRKFTEAKQAVRRIRQPGLLISVRVDKRFDSISKSSPEIMDIDRAVAAEIADLRVIARDSPRSMLAAIQLSYALLKARRYDEVLSLTADVMQRVDRRDTGKPAYDDAGDELIWILNNRAIAFGGLGRRDEELELLIRAARRPEHGGPNVSQAINLGEFYCELGRPKDALFAIVDVENASAYGKTQVENVHLCAGLQLGDQDAVAKALSYLKEHLTDSPKTYQAVLIDVQDFDGAAAILISRLNDPLLRSDALAEVQNYLDPTDLSWPVQSRDHFQTIIHRPDVMKIITQFGRIESFKLRSDLN